MFQGAGVLLVHSLREGELPVACVETGTGSFKVRIYYLWEFIAALKVLQVSFAESVAGAAWSGQTERCCAGLSLAGAARASPQHRLQPACPRGRREEPEQSWGGGFKAGRKALTIPPELLQLGEAESDGET